VLLISILKLVEVYLHLVPGAQFDLFAPNPVPTSQQT